MTVNWAEEEEGYYGQSFRKNEENEVEELGAQLERVICPEETLECERSVEQQQQQRYKQNNNNNKMKHVEESIPLWCLQRENKEDKQTGDDYWF